MADSGKGCYSQSLKSLKSRANTTSLLLVEKQTHIAISLYLDLFFFNQMFTVAKLELEDKPFKKK